MVTLVRPDSPHLWSIAINLDFQDFEHELQHLASEYGPPDGLFLLAQQAGAFVGCGAIRRLSESSCEMKRLYVSPQSQNRGVGRLVATTLIAEARALGYESVLLDTLPSMSAARALYESLGFVLVASYRFNPVPGASFMKLDLRDLSGQAN